MYVNLFNDHDFPHKPEVLGIAILDFDGRGRGYFASLDQLEFSEKMKEVLANRLSIEQFMEKVVALCQLKS